MRKSFLIAGLCVLAAPAMEQQKRAAGIITGGAPVSGSNPLAVNASVSASISGFQPALTGTPISVTTGGNTGTLPAARAVVVVLQRCYDKHGVL